jgi:hypothetical protein
MRSFSNPRSLLGTTLMLGLLLVACGDDTGGGGGAGGAGSGGGAQSSSQTGTSQAGTGQTGSSQSGSAQGPSSTTGGDECTAGGGEAAVGPCLVAAHAGTFQVTATSGSHQRGSITIGADGAIDYDDALQFPIVDFEGEYDRLECCQRISVEMDQRPDNDTGLDPLARHRVDVFTDSTTSGGAVVRFEYFPNWPSEEGKVLLDVDG